MISVLLLSAALLAPQPKCFAILVRNDSGFIVTDRVCTFHPMDGEQKFREA